LMPLSGNHWLHVEAGVVFFDHATPATGLELWAFWPGLTMPRLVGDVWPGPASSSPRPGAVTGTRYLFSAEDPAVGNELFGVTLDVTPPTIEVTVNGQPPTDEVFKGDVAVRFVVTDAESAITTTTGCEPQTLTTDTTRMGTRLRCRAQSIGGVSERSLVLRKDSSPPRLECPTGPVVFREGTVDLKVRATDAFDTSPVVVFQPALAEVTPLTESVLVTATDSSGFTATCTVNVALDAAPPVPSPPMKACAVTPSQLSALGLAFMLRALRRRASRRQGIVSSSW
jgi:large repetitive protein